MSKLNTPWGPIDSTEFSEVKVRFWTPRTFTGMGGSEQLKNGLWHSKHQAALVQLGSGYVPVKIGGGADIWFPGFIEEKAPA